MATIEETIKSLQGRYNPWRLFAVLVEPRLAHIKPLFRHVAALGYMAKGDKGDDPIMWRCLEARPKIANGPFWNLLTKSETFLVPPAEWPKELFLAWRHPDPPSPWAVAHQLCKPTPLVSRWAVQAQPIEVQFGWSLFHYWLIGLKPEALRACLKAAGVPMSRAAFTALLALSLRSVIKSSGAFGLWAFQPPTLPIILSPRDEEIARLCLAGRPELLERKNGGSPVPADIFSLWQHPLCRALADGARLPRQGESPLPPEDERSPFLFKSMDERESSPYAESQEIIYRESIGLPRRRSESYGATRVAAYRAGVRVRPHPRGGLKS